MRCQVGHIHPHTPNMTNSIRQLPIWLKFDDMTPPFGLGEPPYVAMPIPAVFIRCVTPNIAFSVQRFSVPGRMMLLFACAGQFVLGGRQIFQRYGHLRFINNTNQPKRKTGYAAGGRHDQDLIRLFWLILIDDLVDIRDQAHDKERHHYRPADHAFLPVLPCYVYHRKQGEAIYDSLRNG